MTIAENMTAIPQNQQQEMQSAMPAAPGQSFINVGQRERWITAGAGGILALYGLRRLGITGLLGLGAGFMLLRRAWTGHCDAYAAFGINTSGAEGASPEQYFERGIHVEETFLINKPASELYQFWRKLDNLPRFMSHLQSVTVQDDKRSHWVANGPAGMNVEWDAEIINDEPDRLLAWRSLGGATVDNAGSVRFLETPGGRGTEVAVTIDYIPPAGRVGSLIAKLFGRDADQMVRQDLWRFKSLMEGSQA